MKTENISNLKKLRLEYKWSQIQLSELSGLSIRTIQRIENGKKPSLDSLKALSTVFELDFCFSENPSQLKDHENYYKKVRFFLFKLGVFIIIQIIMFIETIEKPTNWSSFFVVLLFCLYFLWKPLNETFDLSKKIKKFIINNKYN